MGRSYIFSSESVTEGHPDKVADQISDAVLDDLIKHDKRSRVACETLVTTGMALVAGEITSTHQPDYPKIVRDTVREIGYTHGSMGFDADTCAILVALDKQSPDISQGVTVGQGLYKEQGAGDQGIMFGYACNETEEYMPMPISFAHRLTKRLAEARKNKELNFLRPDGKSQVSIKYVDEQPVHVDTIVVSTQHTPEVGYEELKKGIIEKIIKPVIPAKLLDSNTKYFINPTGRFVVGGPQGDCGLTGRKIIVDTYGGQGSHGGGAFSGKDPSKVDRSASYMARYIAKNIVAAGYADKCLVQVAYAIGYPEPVSLFINDYGKGKVALEKLEKAVRDVFPLKPSGIIEYLDLLRPIYKKTAAYGHFGRSESDFTWEKTDKVEALRRALS